IRSNRTIFRRLSGKGGGGKRAGQTYFPLRELFANLAVMLDALALAEILEFEHLADLKFALALVRVGAALHPLDGFRLRLDVDDPVAGDVLLRFRERPVDHRALVAVEADARALRAWLQAVAVHHDAGLDHLLVELRHRAEQFL